MIYVEANDQESIITKDYHIFSEKPDEEDDANSKLVNAVINGDLEKVKIIISKQPELLLQDFPSDSSSVDSSTDSSVDFSNLFDLSVKHRHNSILSFLVDEGFTLNKDSFENYLSRKDFAYSSDILNEVMKHESKAGVMMLNKSINMNSDAVVSVDFKNLTSEVMETILTHGCQEVSQHPLIESQTILKWKTNRFFALTFLILHLIHTLLLSSAVIVHNYSQTYLHNDIFLVILSIALFLYIPILFLSCLLVLNIARPLQDKLKILLQVLYTLFFLMFTVISYVGVVDQFSVHVRTWAVLLAWIQLFMHLHDLPETTFYISLFINVSCDIIKFVLMFITVLIGFSLSLHSILPEHDATFKSPVNAMLKLLSFSVGDINFNSTYLQEMVWGHGTVQIIFILIFFTVNIVMINIMIGLTITSIHDTFQTRHQMKFVRTMLYNHKMERMLSVLRDKMRRCQLSKYRCCWKLFENSGFKEVILKTSNNTKNNSSQSLLKKFSKPLGNQNIQDLGILLNQYFDVLNANIVFSSSVYIKQYHR